MKNLRLWGTYWGIFDILFYKRYLLATNPIGHRRFTYTITIDLIGEKFHYNQYKSYLIFSSRILEIYGMSECSGPHTVNSFEAQRIGSIGKSMRGLQTKTGSAEGDHDTRY